MIRNTIALLADTVIRDADRNLMSAINIMEGVVAEGLPIIFPRLTFFTLWERDPIDPETLTGTIAVQIGKNIILQQAVTLDFQRKSRTRLCASFQGLPITETGVLRFTLQLNAGPSAEACIDIERRAQMPGIPA